MEVGGALTESERQPSRERKLREVSGLRKHDEQSQKLHRHAAVI